MFTRGEGTFVVDHPGVEDIGQDRVQRAPREWLRLPGSAGASRSKDRSAVEGGRVTPFQTATRNLIASLGACTRSCLVSRYRSVVWTDACPRSN